jgi:archaellum component FlaC
MKRITCRFILVGTQQEDVMTLVERLRHRDRIVHPNSRETFDLVKEAADEIERLNGLVAMQKKDMKVAMDRIAELEGASE